MTNRCNRIKLALIFVACLVATWAAFDTPAGAQAPSRLSPQESRGKQIYLKGEGGEQGEITAVLGSSELELPASSFSCSNCHGLAGEGTKEGGIQPPPINWATLTSPQISALTRRGRAPYTEATLARAISSGIGPDKTPLHPGMPRYKMTPGQMADLLAYLKKLGTEADAETGISEATIKVGAALPLTGPLAQVGEDVKVTLAAFFAEVNAQGGIYHRRFELVVADSQGKPAATLEATRQLTEREGVFAFVGSFEPQDGDAANEFLRRSEVPLIGPVTLSPRLAVPPNAYIFYLLPTFSDQARSLVDFVGSKAAQSRAGGESAKQSPAQRQAPRLAVVYASGEFDRDALVGLRTQAKMYAMEIVAEHEYERGGFSASSAVESLLRNMPDHIFFFGGPQEIIAFAREAERAKLNAALLSSVVMIGRGAFDLPESVAARTFLSYPAIPPNQNDFAEFLTIMGKGKVSLRSPAFQSVAYAAAKIFVEATKLSGRQLNRRALVSALERLRDFNTGVVPPVSFNPNRRVGATGSYIVGIDLTNKQYVSLSNQLVPKDRP